MKKQELEELRRLEEELMAEEYAPEELDEMDLMDETWQEIADIPVEAYNTDVSDVDPQVYMEALNQAPPKRSAAPVVWIVLLSCLVIFCALKLLEVV